MVILVRENAIKSVYKTMKEYDKTKRILHKEISWNILEQMSQKLQNILNKVDFDRSDTLMDKVKK